MRLQLVVVAILFVCACDGGRPCEDEHTGFISIVNTGDVCFDVTMNGAAVGESCPDAALGVSQPVGSVSVEMAFADGSEACAPLTANVVECGDQSFDCDSGPAP